MPFFRDGRERREGLAQAEGRARPGRRCIALLTHKDIVRRYAAALRLAGLGERQAIAPLAREAVNPDQPVEARAAFLKALTALPDARATAAALRVLDDQPPTPGAPEGPDPGGVLKAAALRLLARADTADLGSLTPRLVAYLDDAAPAVRHAAVQALSAVGDAAAIPALERVQQADDAAIPAPGRAGGQRTRLRSAAAEAITRIRARAAG